VHEESGQRRRDLGAQAAAVLIQRTDAHALAHRPGRVRGREGHGRGQYSGGVSDHHIGGNGNRQKDDQDQNGVIELQPDRRIHGEVGFGIGTGGYRDAFAAVNMPVGQSGRLGVAVEDTQYGKPWRGEYRSLDVNLALGGAASAPRECGSAIRVGDRFVQPLWVGQFRDSPLDDVDPRCIAQGPAHR